MKPPGISMGLSGNALTIGVTATDRVTDKIWSAVEEALEAGMSADRFKREVLQAWDHHVKQQLKWDLETLRK